MSEAYKASHKNVGTHPAHSAEDPEDDQEVQELSPSNSTEMSGPHANGLLIPLTPETPPFAGFSCIGASGTHSLPLRLAASSSTSDAHAQEAQASGADHKKTITSEASASGSKPKDNGPKNRKQRRNLEKSTAKAQREERAAKKNTSLKKPSLQNFEPTSLLKKQAYKQKTHINNELHFGEEQRLFPLSHFMIPAMPN